MLITAAELLKQGKPATRDDIRTFLSGNYCRCTGYHAIVDAVEDTLNARLDDSGEATAVRSSGVKHSAGNSEHHGCQGPLDSARPAEQLCRPHASRARAHGARWRGAATYTDDISLAAHGARRVRSQPPCPRQDRAHGDRRGRACAGSRQGDDRRRARQDVHRALGRHADLLSRHEVGPAISDGGRSRLLAGRAGRHGGGTDARARGGRGGAGRDRVAGAAGSGAQGNCARSQDARCCIRSSATISRSAR